MSCLHQFPIDYLKLDRSFIANVTESPELAALLTAVLTLAYHLDLKVVAEGIETLDQLEKLKELGCHYGQGYLFDKPMSSESFVTFVNSTRPWGQANSDSTEHSADSRFSWIDH